MRKLPSHTAAWTAHDAHCQAQDLIVATCAAALIALAAPLEAAQPGDALPDLVSDAPVMNSADPDYPAGGLEHDVAHDRLLLRFDGFVHNAAPAPAGWSGGPAPGALEVRGSRPDTASSMVPIQRIYDDTGASSRDDTSRDTSLRFETADGHNHWHFMRAARYSLWDDARAGQVAPSMKVGFCLEERSPSRRPTPSPSGTRTRTRSSRGASASAATATRSLEDLCTRHAGGVVVCFSHADPIKAAVAHALGTHLDLFQRIAISPGSVSAIAFVEGQAPAVLMVNSTSEPLSGLRAP